MEFQLQIFLIIGIGSFFIAALILTSSLLAYYVVKLYKRLNEEQEENSYLRKHGVGISNIGVDLDDELNRRYTMHTPEPQILEISRVEDRTLQRRNDKDSSKTNTGNRSSVIDVSEEFNWSKTEGGSKYNSNITLQHKETHEIRTSFNDRSF